MKYTKFTDKEIKYLIQNHSVLGPKQCALNLKRKSWMYLHKKALSLGLNRNKTSLNLYKSPKSVCMDKFVSINSPMVCYILGFIWADGSISKMKNRISVGIGKKDFNDINNCLLKEIPFHIHFMKRNGNPVFYLSDLQLHTFLKENDYLIKSLTTPSKILSKIPKRLHHYFFRGFFDGDGCFTNITKCPTIIFTGSYNQDWTDTTNLIVKLTNHSPKILRRIMKKGHKASMVYFYGKDRIKKFLDYLYQGETIGLSRKRERYEKFTSLL